MERNDTVFSSLPGGFIQIKETPAQTARRRFADEALGISVVSVLHASLEVIENIHTGPGP